MGMKKRSVAETRAMAERRGSPAVAKLGEALAKSGLSKNGFAEKLGTHPRHLRKWLSGQHPIPKTVERLLEALG